MTAYIIAKAEITDKVKYQEYLKAVPGIIEKYGGKAIVRGGKTETLEGAPNKKRIVILEFPSIEKAKEFYYSTEYQEAKKIRKDAAVGELIIVEGVNM